MKVAALKGMDPSVSHEADDILEPEHTNCDAD